MITSWQEVPFLRPFILVLVGTLAFDWVDVSIEVWGVIISGLFGLLYFLDIKKRLLSYQGIFIFLLLISLAGLRLDKRKQVDRDHFHNFSSNEIEYVEIKVNNV